MCNRFFSLITLLCLLTILFPLHWGLIYTLLGCLKLSNSHWHSLDFFTSLFLTFWCLTVNSFFFCFHCLIFSKSCRACFLFVLFFARSFIISSDLISISILSTALHHQSFSFFLGGGTLTIVSIPVLTDFLLIL